MRWSQHQLCHTTSPLRYHDGRDTRNYRYRCRGKCKTLRTLPSWHRIEQDFVNGYKTIGLTPRTSIGKSGCLEIVLKITYHRQQSSVCFGEIMQFRWSQYQLCRTTTPLRYCDGRDNENCRCRCRGKCKTLRNLPSGHGIEPGFFIAIEL
jgi:hypothetical protein